MITGKLIRLDSKYREDNNDDGGLIGAFAYEYDGVNYYIGDVVDVYYNSNDSNNFKTTIITRSFDGVLPMWFSSFEHCKRCKYRLSLRTSYENLKNNDLYCNDGIRVRLSCDLKNIVNSKEKFFDFITTLTREEFLNDYYINEIKDAIQSVCPNKYGLINPDSDECIRKNCTDCWREAVEHLKFKDDLISEGLMNSNDIRISTSEIITTSLPNLESTPNTDSVQSKFIVDSKLYSLEMVLSSNSEDLFLCNLDGLTYELTTTTNGVDVVSVLVDKANNKLFVLNSKTINAKFIKINIQ